MSPDPALLHDLLQRILKVTRPLRVILFGSAARGQMGKHSDLDVLVVVPDGSRTLDIAKALYRGTGALDVSKDFVVVTESDVERLAHAWHTPIPSALQEGRELYRVSTA